MQTQDYLIAHYIIIDISTINSVHHPTNNKALHQSFWNKNWSKIHLIQISLPQWQCSALAKRTNKSMLLHARGQFPLISSSPRTASLASGSTTKCRHFEMGTATHTKPANTTRFYTNPWTPRPGPSRPLRVCKCRAVEGPVLLWLSWIGRARR